MKFLCFWLAVLLPQWVTAVTSLTGLYGGCLPNAVLQVRDANPSDYQGVIDSAVSGDLIRLASGTYTNGLRVYNLNGMPGQCIVIEGPIDRSAILVGQPINGIRNVIQIRNASYVVIRNVEIDGVNTTDLDAIKADANVVAGHPNPWSHHITLENIHIHDFDFNQQQVGISTKGPAWNWVVREVAIERVGTGIYFGNSDGAEHFVGGLVEYNLIRDTVGYNMQVKHQLQAFRPAGIGYETMPMNAQTVIRHNVFQKSVNSSVGGAARPNLLVGAFPLSGAGSDDDYLIQGNFFYRNPSGVEALFQGEGNVILVGNLLYNDQGPGLFIQPQNGEVRRVRLFQNTVLSAAAGIFVSATVNGAYAQLVRGNAVFANGIPISGGTQVDNQVDNLNNAGSYVANPSGIISGMSNRMDLFPLPGQLSGAPINLSPIASYIDFDRDFNDSVRSGVWRGAYAGVGANPGWQLALAVKPGTTVGLIFGNGFED